MQHNTVLSWLESGWFVNAPLEVSLHDRIHFCMVSQSNLSQSQIFDGKICIVIMVFTIIILDSGQSYQQ